MKFSIVTPSFNSERFIAETIESVLSQMGDFEIEYIIADNCSTDSTVSIIRKYEDLLREKQYAIRCNAVAFRYIVEKDRGMYDAINRSFSLSSGDIFAWINSDDIYLPGAFQIVARTFQAYPAVKWLKGITSYLNESSSISQKGKCYLYDQRWIQRGIYGRDLYFIQQDSVFWRSELWKAAGGIDKGLKRAGDYALWIKFSHYTPLYTVKAYVSCFRKVAGQLSEDIRAYKLEAEQVLRPSGDEALIKKIMMFFAVAPKIAVPFLRKLLYRLIFGRQNLFLVEIAADGTPVLKPASYYVSE